MSAHAFIDESIRGDRYLICASIVDARALGATRQSLRLLLGRGQQRIHFNNESNTRRRLILRRIADFAAVSVICAARDNDQVRARTAALHEVVVHLRSSDVGRLVLEARQGQDHRDRAVIRRAAGIDDKRVFGYTHLTPVNEPLLWIPDAVAWAWGRGGAWRQMVRDLRLVGRVWQV